IGLTPEATSGLFPPPTIFPSPAKQVPVIVVSTTRTSFSIVSHSHLITHPRRSCIAISSHSAITMDIDPARRNKKPRLLLETEREKLDEFVDSIHYSARYNDDKFEYRHVQLPKNMLKKIPADYFDSAKGTLKLLWEEEWRALGITQSLGWEHYEVHEPEPHILLFKRPLNYQPPLQQ
ncbi:hypothetical protein N7447_005255, partial [Penicillium robsamsonii]|uniref:uncharacterized protein n=1 Tax=Penicillium robsamsonii TaxID=1792511 RepID=UPI00254811DB